jgi:DNA (cytosine-5)-methyltransferase 1
MLTVIELFAGIGSQTQALKNIGIEHKVIGISEINKYAIMVYEMLHGKVNNFGDITKIESLPYCDLLTYSFPCQDLSIAGKQAGIKEGTRSGLLLQVERLLNDMPIKPKYLLLENVKNLISDKFYPDYEKWLNELASFGYVNY